MSEVAQTADHLIVIGHGRIVADASIDVVIGQHGMRSVTVKSDRQAELAERLVRRGGRVEPAGDGAITVLGLEPTVIGAVAVDERIALSELTPRHASLEEAFFQLTHDLDLSTAELVPQGD
jgi:ABC-2 type transport system ATP-binding protein